MKDVARIAKFAKTRKYWHVYELLPMTKFVKSALDCAVLGHGRRTRLCFKTHVFEASR